VAKVLKLNSLKNKISLLLKRILFVTIYMVVLTIATKENGETVYFKDPIPKVHFIKLISCSLFNSWYNLEKVGSIIKKVDSDDIIYKRLPPGHYNPKALRQKLSELTAETNQPSGQLVITKEGSKDIIVDKCLSLLINLVPDDVSLNLDSKTTIGKIKYEMVYFINCDLTDRTKNFLNGERSTF